MTKEVKSPQELVVWFGKFTLGDVIVVVVDADGDDETQEPSVLSVLFVGD